MAGEVLYADLKLPGSSFSSHPSPHARSQTVPEWYHLAFRISGVLNVILLLAVIILSVFSIMSFSKDACSKKTSDPTSTNCTSEPSINPQWANLSGEGNGTERCPLNWLLHRGKCYYFSKEERNWNRSREDCREKDSDLLVIKDQEERDFIKNRKQNNLHWIGLHILALGSSWTWVDGSSFINGTLFSVSTGKGRCVSVVNDRYDSDSCNNAANWICQKKAGKGGKSLSAEGKC
uniref:Killer cell lectin-like receptor subfamily B member 1B allele C n=1 Tax=Geotrypetes seraphini TaxID=260995 RepID=A0A6P8Q1P7_GEOSA|nr:killer cell lectin-like receptor subfamily B member 1B allele C [Geotrypetes seraphini]